MRDIMKKFNEVKKINFEDTQRISDEQLEKLFKSEDLEGQLENQWHLKSDLQTPFD